jgi:hypothetical protein
VRSVDDWIFIVGGAGLAVTGPIRDIGRTFYSLLFKQEVVRAHIFLLAFLEEPFIINIIYGNYTMLYLCNIIIICVNNNSIINNNYGRLQVHIFLFKIPTGTGNVLFEIGRHYRHEPRRSFCSPAVDY